MIDTVIEKTVVTSSDSINFVQNLELMDVTHIIFVSVIILGVYYSTKYLEDLFI